MGELKEENPASKFEDKLCRIIKWVKKQRGLLWPSVVSRFELARADVRLGAKMTIAASVREQAFDVAEMAILTYLMAKSFGKPMVLLPHVVWWFAVAVRGGGIQNGRSGIGTTSARISNARNAGRVGWVDLRPNWSDVIDSNKGVG